MFANIDHLAVLTPMSVVGLTNISATLLATPAAKTRSMRLSSLLFLLCMACAATLVAQVPNNYVTQQADLPCLQKTFGLRVHINDDVLGAPNPFDTVAFEAMVRSANSYFEPICVGFEACEYLSIENYRYSSYERNDMAEQVSLYADRNRIDVFITVRDSFGLACGRADSNGINSNPRSSIMLVANCMDSTSQELSHQLGHYFNLLHTFEPSIEGELVDGSNCATTGDFICDTPADPYLENSGIQYVDPQDPCRFVWRGQDANGQFYVPHTGNIMSFYSDACACGFTHDQLARMAAAIASGAGRVW